jgi:hypothetical protein
MSCDPEEERFARQDSGRYSGWASAFTIAVIVIVLCILLSKVACKRLPFQTFRNSSGSLAIFAAIRRALPPSMQIVWGVGTQPNKSRSDLVLRRLQKILISFDQATVGRCPLYPRKRTFAHAIRMSALGHQRTLSATQHLVGELRCSGTFRPSALVVLRLNHSDVE